MGLPCAVDSRHGPAEEGEEEAEEEEAADAGVGEVVYCGGH